VQAEQGRRKRRQRGRGLIFISTAAVYMNRMLPARGGSFFISAIRRNEKLTYLIYALSASTES